MINNSIPGKGLYDEEAKQQRINFIKNERKVDLKNIGETTLSVLKVKNNIESFVGTVEVPVGIAGPLLIHGECDNELIYAPFATTEGVLVASATRGAKLLTLSVGVYTKVLRQRMVRIHTFEFEGMKQAYEASLWIIDNAETVKKEVKEKSHHAVLVELIPFVVGKYLHVYFIHETGDAAGQNMTTVCTWHLCQSLTEIFNHVLKNDVKNFLVEGNLSSDKKVLWQNFIHGRGMRVIAECRVSSDVLSEVFHVTAQKFMHNYSIMLSSSITAGSIGANGNIANVVAAIFTATGQDIASVHEASIGQLHTEIDESKNGIYLSLMMLSLTIGTISGGTGLLGQEECLTLLGCKGTGKSRRLR